MKRWFLFIIFWLYVTSTFAETTSRVSGDKALAIIEALPEFVELRRKYKDDIEIDGPTPYASSKRERDTAGIRGWLIDVYIEVHDDAENGHFSRYAFFRVDGESGEVSVYDFDYRSGDFVTLTLSEWRARRVKR